MQENVKRCTIFPYHLPLFSEFSSSFLIVERRTPLKRSINAWTFPAEYTFEDCFRIARKAGFDAIEFNVDNKEKSAHSFSLESTDAEIEAVAALAKKYGIECPSVSTSLTAGLWAKSDAQSIERIRKIVEMQLKIAKGLGADTILTVPGGMTDGMLLSEARANSIKNLKDFLPTVEKYGVKIGLENVWNAFFLSPYDMVSFIDELGSDMFGAYFDLGNMVAFSDTVHWADVLAEKTFKLHVKDYKRDSGVNRGGKFVQLLEGDVDFKRSMAILKAKGFDGYLTAEVFKDDPEMSDIDYLASIVEAEKVIQKYYDEA